MPFEHDIGDSTPEFNPHFDLGKIYCTDDNTEGDALYKIVQASKHVKPSIICGLARIAYDLEHFNKCLSALCVATTFPDDADAIAGDIVDTFRLQDADKADHAYKLIMLAVSHAVSPDANWQSISNLTFKLAADLT